MGLPAPLQQLARLYGLQTEYVNMAGKVQTADPASLRVVLQSLGACVRGEADFQKAIRLRQKELWSRWVEPVAVAWEGRLPFLKIRLPEPAASGRLEFTLRLESGEERSGAISLSRSKALQAVQVSGRPTLVKAVPVPGPLPLGYHRLRLRLGRRSAETLLLASPRHAYPLFGSRTRKGWGPFVPPYAVHSGRSWGAGDLTDLEGLAEWAAGMGAQMVATLPLFPLFLNRPFEPSPYAPISRLFWNEFWLDVTRLPEWDSCRGAQATVESAAFRRKLEQLRRSPLVDYRRQMECKRLVLERLAEDFFRHGRDRQTDFRDFLKVHPEVVPFARFVAQREQPGRSRLGWRYPLYAQWAASRQMHAFSERCRQRGVSLYLDFPLGVHPDGYDVWRWRDLFVPGTSVGAPPDTFFTGGQDWGFLPFQPDAMRDQGYQYFRDCLAHSMRPAGLLRIDHVMGLHRLFWIPRGFRPRQGIYVRYPAEEWYAVLTLESHRNRCAVVGENLGTVPPEVGSALRRHGLLRMFVVQYELRPDFKKPMPDPPGPSVASLNTHDMPPFSAFWEGRDIRERRRSGLLDARGVKEAPLRGTSPDKNVKEEARRRAEIRSALTRWLRVRRWLKAGEVGPSAVLRGCLRGLSASRARVIQISPEDLWGETEPQNVPGTTTERPNWRRKWRYRLEQLKRRDRVNRVLEEVNSLRHGEKPIGV